MPNCAHPNCIRNGQGCPWVFLWSAYFGAVLDELRKLDWKGSLQPRHFGDFQAKFSALGLDSAYLVDSYWRRFSTIRWTGETESHNALGKESGGIPRITSILSLEEIPTCSFIRFWGLGVPKIPSASLRLCFHCAALLDCSIMSLWLVTNSHHLICRHEVHCLRLTRSRHCVWILVSSKKIQISYLHEYLFCPWHCTEIEAFLSKTRVMHRYFPNTASRVLQRVRGLQHLHILLEGTGSFLDPDCFINNHGKTLRILVWE